MTELLLHLEGVIVQPSFVRAAIRPYAEARRGAWHRAHPGEDPSEHALDLLLWAEALQQAVTTTPHRDVVRNLRRLRALGARIGLFGEPQSDLLELLMRHTTHDDLRPLFDRYLGGAVLTDPSTWTGWRVGGARVVTTDPAVAQAAADAGANARLLDRASAACGAITSLDDL